MPEFEGKHYRYTAAGKAAHAKAKAKAQSKKKVTKRTVIRRAKKK